MGSSAHVVVVHDDRAEAERLVERARRRIDELEARWSRFQPASELTRLNACRGVPVRVSRDTFELVVYAMRAYVATGGRYDPSVADALVALGYDRDFASIDRGAGALAAATTGCAPTPSASNDLVALLLDPYVPAVTLPVGAGIDPGGIGKGLAGDMVVGELLVADARGAMVNIGGDVVARGDAPDEHGWIVGIADPHRPRLASRARTSRCRCRVGGRVHEQSVDALVASKRRHRGPPSSRSPVASPAAYAAGGDHSRRR